MQDNVCQFLMCPQSNSTFNWNYKDYYWRWYPRVVHPRFD